MKNLIKTAFVLLLSLVLTFGTIACRSSRNPSSSGGNGPVQIDPEKTQLYIGVYDGGYGIAFAEEWGAKFAALNKETSFEEGKKGVEVIVTPSKEYALDDLAFSLTTQLDEICFIEQCNIYNLLAYEQVYDITDWVTEPLTEYGEQESIQDKMNPMDVDYYSQDAQNPEYYAVPWYYSMMGINYDIKLFEDNLLYFAADGVGDSDGFITSLYDKRSNGPDGRTGIIDGVDYSQDDGHPATYDDFFKLCDRIVEYGMTPIIWAGSVQNYVSTLLMSFAADFEGYENMSLNYTFDGTATNLIKNIENGIAVLEQPTKITAENGYLLRKQAGWYHALKFLHRLITTKNDDGEPKYYNYDDCFGVSFAHKSAQTKFLRSNYSNTTKSIAMLIDGTWWYNEADETFTNMSGMVGASKRDRKIGIMSIPKVDSSKVGEDTTLMQTWISSVVVRGNIAPEKVNVAKAFFRFIHTDENLSSFIPNACGIRPYEHELINVDLNTVPVFVSEQYNLYQSNKSVSPYAYNDICKEKLNLIHRNFATDFAYSMPTTAFDEGVSAERYFNGLAGYLDSTRWENQILN